MARTKGWKRWDGLTASEWQSLFATPSVISDLMMQMIFLIYHAPNQRDNAKHVAEQLFMEYRALNAAVGWAGNKIKKRYEDRVLKEKNTADMPPWQYVFDGQEDEYGMYLWIIKPHMAEALKEIEGADISATEDIKKWLAKDVSAYGTEGNLFSASSDETVLRIRDTLAERERFFRKSLSENPCCAVCGVTRLSLLRAVPYGDDERKQKGLLFCPTHATLFATHLISFTRHGTLTVSPHLSEEEIKALGISKGSKIHGHFSQRRMAIHRKICHEEGRTKQ